MKILSSERPHVAVMYGGKIVSVMPVDEVTEHKLGFLMLGGRLEDYKAGEVTWPCKSRARATPLARSGHALWPLWFLALIIWAQVLYSLWVRTP
jgi:hypothetical protein